VRPTAGLPLLVMLHGCSQTTEAFAASTRMNQIAAKEGFVVLYPEQNKLANLQACWNWHQTSSGRAQHEVNAIHATIDQVCQRQSIDPARFRAIAMHSGIAPGSADHLVAPGTASQAYSDPKGPDASRMIWAFALKQFTKVAA